MSDDPDDGFLDRVMPRHHDRRLRRNADPEIRHHFVPEREEGPDRVHEDERGEAVDP